MTNLLVLIPYINFVLSVYYKLPVMYFVKHTTTNTSDVFVNILVWLFSPCLY